MEFSEDYFGQYELWGQEAEAHKAELKRAFMIPRLVSTVDGDMGKRIVFPHVHPVAPLVRLTVCENLAPPRHKVMVSCGDPDDEANDYWQPLLHIYVFACPMPHTIPLTIEYRREPYCSRLHMGKNPQQRDITKWHRHEPQIKGFYAYPQPVAGSSPFYLDWSSGPDRYMISTNRNMPSLGWLRCSGFHALQATKFHVLEGHDPVHCYRVVAGGHCPVHRGWICLFAFFAFEGPEPPGTSRFYLQHRYEPYYTMRVAKEPTYEHGWTDYATFCAFDVPMPGTSRFSVDFLTGNVDSRQNVAEQTRIFAADTWEPWVEKLFFYAFPAPTILFPPKS